MFTVATVPPMILVVGLTPHLQVCSLIEFSGKLVAGDGLGSVILLMV